MKNSVFVAILFIILTLTLSGCEKKGKDVRYTGSKAFQDCKAQPPFVQSIGFDLNRSAFSTSEKKSKGLSFIQFPSSPTANDSKLYQHPSWKQFGWLGPMAIDEKGNIYLAPIPVVNVLDNPFKKQVEIYKVNAQTGEMSLYYRLPVEKEPHERNPYGILGLVYDCETSILIATSVSGSERDTVSGGIYSISTKGTPALLDKLEQVDAMGVGVNYLNEEKRIFWGDVRNGDILSVEFTKEGKFEGNPRKECTLADLGQRGDDKPRKIRFNKDGDMVVMGVEFNFNLIAPTEKQETPYSFRYDIFERKWSFIADKSFL